MKVEVGDWVKIRGLKRIYEVQGTTPQSGDAAFIALAGSKVLHRANTIEAVAPKFWIKTTKEAQ